MNYIIRFYVRGPGVSFIDRVLCLDTSNREQAIVRATKSIKTAYANYRTELLSVEFTAIKDAPEKGAGSEPSTYHLA
jgi:hypothetical protein